jgi:D-sedoheptulose 7-phosphate isomerase
MDRYPQLKPLQQSICEATTIIIEAYNHGNKVVICGNGGSAADSLHMVGELMKAFVLPRQIPSEDADKIRKSAPHAAYLVDHLERAFPAISLVNEAGLLTAYANDVAADMNFAQQVYGQGKKGDVLFAISTSGNSANVLYAAEVAKAFDIKVVGLTGMTGGKMKDTCDVLINVPELKTFKIQELHLPVYHAICLAVEAEFYE